MAFKILSILIAVSLTLCLARDDDAHSFMHFEGPVMGKDSEITWKDKHGDEHQDYVAQPHYEFAYGVEDRHTGDYHGQKEHRDGKDVVGEYTVKEPSGNIRTVKYRAGKDGFHAHVSNSHGESNGHRHQDSHEDEDDSRR